MIRALLFGAIADAVAIPTLNKGITNTALLAVEYGERE